MSAARRLFGYAFEDPAVSSRTWTRSLILASHHPDAASKEVAALGLVRQSGSGALLADGSVRQFDIFAAEVEWGGTWRPVMVSAIGDESLMGMRLLADHKLVIEVIPGGSVEILPLP